MSAASAREAPLDPDSRQVLVHRVISYHGQHPDPTPGEPLTDAGVARRLGTVFGDELRHVAEWRDWIFWDGNRWRPDIGAAVALWRIGAVGRALLVISGMVEGRREREDWLAAARRYESRTGVEAALRAARTDPQLTVYSNDLDRPLHLFNVSNGTLDLSVPGLREHRPEDLMTRMSPAEYAVSGGGGEAAERWQGFLKRVLPDKEVREFVQRLIGYSMSGEVTEHVLAIFTGSGQNGKGTFRDAVLAAFGDYGYETNPRILLEGASERHTTELMELRGRRLVFCSEIGRKQRLDAAVMKRLVGGDPIEARRMRADPVSFMPSHTLITMTNHLPAVDADDKALWRRLRVVPWDVEIPEAERDGLLPRKLREPEVQREIIRWAFEGWKAYQERGLEAPEAVSARTAVYRTENDLIARFLDERTLKVETKAAVIRARELYAAYVTWCNRVGEEADTETAFGKSMKLAGYEKKRTNKGWFYERLILTPDE